MSTPPVFTATELSTSPVFTAAELSTPQGLLLRNYIPRCLVLYYPHAWDGLEMQNYRPSRIAQRVTVTSLCVRSFVYNTNLLILYAQLYAMLLVLRGL